jgi:hypothetical protein
MFAILTLPWVNPKSAEEAYYAEAIPIHIPANAEVRIIRISPRFPGCDDAPDKDECARQRLEDYLYDNTTYPSSTNNKGTAGLAMVQLRISSVGKMENISLLRDPGYGRGADVLRIIQKMQRENIRWTPASINGRPISFQITLKIRYSNFYWTQ